MVTLSAVGLLAGCGGSSGGDDGPATPANPGPTPGLVGRPQNLSCVAPDRLGGSAAAIALERVFENLGFTQPLGLLQAPGDGGRWFVLEKPGRVRVFAADPAVAAFDTDFIDLTASFDVNSSSEGGLLGMAFDADFASSGEVFLSWTEGSPMVSRISRFTSDDGGLTLDPGSRNDVISVNQDFGNHNGGHIAFGPDGFLYAGFGDGGDGGDPNSRAQDTTNLLGAMLRLDVDGAAPYEIPPGNPFAANPLCPANHASATDCPEIYAWGLRNPWRFSFDRATLELWAGDVGQNAFEEIDRIEVGRNYGWDCREAFDDYSSPAPSCATATGLADPVHAYGRGLGVSVTGGYVYRGAVIPALVGDYVFGDYGSGRIWRLTEDGGGYVAHELLDTALSIVSFTEDADGELYVVDISGGIYAVVDGGGPGVDPEPVPDALSETGCFDAEDPSQPATGLVPYAVAAPFWSDGADKERWLAIPEGSTIAVDSQGDFQFPAGSVLAKHFRLNGDLIETRLFMRHPDGDWAGYSYEWDDPQTDAQLVVGGKTVTIDGQEWVYPDDDQCSSCHTAAAGFSLGLELAQLNTSFEYPSTGRTANQLLTLDAIAMFASPLGDPSVHPALADPEDPAQSIEMRARAYLHTNCAQCHRPGGPTPAAIDLRFSVGLDATGACGIAPQNGDLGISGALIIAPGEPARSVLLERMSRRGDAAQMPPLASTRVDQAGVALVDAWIAALNGCSP
jgi:uncharacterized repeat protein (TIGR03806 family)